MPENTVSDPITDQEIAFAYLILSGTMDDSRAAEGAGLNPGTVAYAPFIGRFSIHKVIEPPARRRGVLS